MKIPSNDGGPAFPSDNFGQPPQRGMTLRDYFAGQALAAVCSGIEVEVDKLDADGKYAEQNMKALHECAGIRAYLYADAMLSARERKEDAK